MVLPFVLGILWDCIVRWGCCSLVCFELGLDVRFSVVGLRVFRWVCMFSDRVSDSMVC